MGSTLSKIKESKLQNEKKNKVGRKKIIFVGTENVTWFFFKKIFYEHIHESLIASLIQKKKCTVFGADIWEKWWNAFVQLSNIYLCKTQQGVKITVSVKLTSLGSLIANVFTLLLALPGFVVFFFHPIIFLCIVFKLLKSELKMAWVRVGERMNTRFLSVHNFKTHPLMLFDTIFLHVLSTESLSDETILQN